MLKAYPMLNARQTMITSTTNDNKASVNSHDASSDLDDGNKWRERIGKIQNAELLVWDHAVSSSDDEEGAGNSERSRSCQAGTSPSQQHQRPSADSCPIRRELKHGDDFFLLGANAWMLLQQKFGSDGIEIGRPCVFHNTEDSTLAVVLDGHANESSNGSAVGARQLVPVPPTGRFPYEKLVADLEGDSEETFDRQQQPQQQHQQQGDVTSSDVVSDEEGEPNDLVSGPSFSGEIVTCA